MRKRIFNLFLVCIFVLTSCSIFSGEEKEKITKIEFEQSVITLKKGEVKAVNFFVTPDSRVTDCEVEYSLSSNDNIISISSTTSSGLIISALERGSIVLIAKCEGLTSYMEVDVVSSEAVYDPYIKLPDVAYEMNINEKKTIQVSLIGGDENSKALFEWKSSDDNIIHIDSADNACVISAKDYGYATIDISHPDAVYSASIMVYVNKEEESNTYISTKSNVILMGNRSGTQHLYVTLEHSETNNLSLFNFEIMEGSENINIISNNNVCSITPIKNGQSKIKVTHPECVIPLYVNVVVADEMMQCYIDSDKPFIEMCVNESKIVALTLESEEIINEEKKYSFTLDDESICDVTGVDDLLYIKAKKIGQTKIYVKSPLCSNPYEIFVVVQNPNQELYYITTTQNIIRMEEGDKNVELKMHLPGGNQSDFNSFKWNVSDSSILEVITEYGEVVYDRGITINNDKGIDVKAYINAKKPGSATIKVSNPKAEGNDCEIKVIVYEKGTYFNVPVVLGGNGIVKVVKGNTKNESLEIQSGNADVTDLNWTVEDNNIVSVSNNSLDGTFVGRNTGITVCTVKGKNLQHDFQSTVLCGTESELENMTALYTDNSNIELIKGDSGFYEIKHNGNIDDNYTVSINDNTICNARVSGNILIVDAIKEGKTEIIVRNVNCTNNLVFFVKVFEEKSLKYPYYFSFEKFFGVVNGETKKFKLNLVGSTEEEKSLIEWRVEDSSIVQFTGNGETCRIKALKTGQTCIYAHSDKAENDAKIIVYTAEDEASLKSKVILNVEKTNYLSNIGNDIYIKVDINDKTKRENITWNTSDISVVRIDDNYDSAYIRCIGKGNAVVEVGCDNALSVKIFISVTENGDGNVLRDIFVPSVLEFEEGDNYTLNAEIKGYTAEEIKNIKWEIEDIDIGEIISNDYVCYIKAKKSGITYLKVQDTENGIAKKITFVVYEKGAPHLPVISLDKSYYNINVKDILNLELLYGSKIPDDVVQSKIKWESDSECFEINSNGKKATIIGKKEGLGIVKVSGEGIYNEYTFTVAVGNTNSMNGKYVFSSEKIIGIVIGEEYNLNVKLFDSLGNPVNQGLSKIGYELNNEGIIEITQVENVFKIKALKKGNVYISLNHPDVSEEYRVFIYTALSDSDLKKMYPLSTNKDSYLIGIGETVNLKINTINDNSDKLSDIKWGCSDTSICNYVISGDKKECQITGKKEGNVNFIVSHPGSEEDVIFNINISPYKSNNGNINIITDSIVGVVKGTTYNTKVITDLNSYKAAGLIWSSDDESIATVSGTGTEARINGISNGECEIKVAYDEFNYRVIHCYVRDSYEEINSYYGMNIDRRYSVIGIGDNINFIPFYAKSVADSSNTIYTDILQNNVVEIKNNDGLLNIKGINEGIARIRVSNPQTNEFDIYIQVNEKTNGILSDTKTGYLSINQNIFGLDVNKPMEGLKIKVVPVGILESNYNTINWKCLDSSICMVNGNKDECTVFPNKIGNTILQVSSVYSANILEIKLVVSEDGNINIPYLYVSEKAFGLKCGETKELECNIVNMNNADITKFNYSIENEDICQIEGIGNKVIVKGLKSGQTVLNVSYPGMEDVNCVVSVKGISDKLVYLTTEDNYSVVGIGSSINIGVDLVGFEELNQDNFRWDYKDEQSKAIAKLSGNGKSVLVTGLNEGIATFVCTHKNNNLENEALFPIELSVKVNNASDYKPVYMKTESNVVTLKEGEKKTVSMELINGNESDYGYFEWDLVQGSSDIIKVVGSGNQALIQGLSCGIGRISVKNPSCVGKNNMEIIVVVEENEKLNDLYITTESTIIQSKLSDSYKTVNVNLVGGTSEQQLLFTWEILDYESIVKNKDGTSNPVISLVSQTGNQNIIKYIEEGTAVVRVKNSATSYYLDIKFIINEFSDLKFEITNKTMKQYESATVNVNSPTNRTVYYNSSDENIITCYGTNKICCIQAVGVGTAVITARTSDLSMKDEIIVKVEKNDEMVPCYIFTNCDVLTLNTKDNLGTSVKATLSGTYNGKPITESDQNGLKWSIPSGNNNILKFGNSDTLSASGQEIVIIPTGCGNETIRVSHEKAKYYKDVYITVEQDAAMLKISEDFIVCEVDDIGSVTAELTGVPASEENKIIWSTSDSRKVAIVTKDGLGTNVTGKKMTYKALDLSEDGTLITCTYGSMIRNFTVFVKSLPSLHLPVSTDVVRTGQTTYYNITCTPEDYIANLSFNYSTTAYTKSKSESGVVLTGLFKTEKDQKEGKDVPPQGIRLPYLKVTGGAKEGNTTFSFECKSLSSFLTVTTSNKGGILITKSLEYKDGKIISDVNYPSLITGYADSDYVKVYYDLQPDNLNVVISPNIANSFIGDKKPVVTMESDDNGKYLKIIPSCGCNYGDIMILTNDTGDKVGSIRYAFIMDDQDKNFDVISSISGNYKNKTIVDTKNCLIRGSGKQGNTTSIELSLVNKNEDIYNYAINLDSIYALIDNGTVLNDEPLTFNGSDATSSFSYIESIKEKGSVEFEICYPVGYQIVETKKYTFVVFEDIWK